MTRALIGFLCFIFFSSALANPSLNSQIQSIIDKDRIKYHITALSVSIKLPNNANVENFVSGHTTQAKTEKITSNTLFEIGSITKTFTATIIMQLVEKNKLKLDDKLENYFPEYPRWHKVTIRNLLNHTSGIYSYTDNNDFWSEIRANPNKIWTMKDSVDMAYHHPDLFKPGLKFHYSNTDYILLGLIIEAVTHQSIDETFSDYLKKYNLKNTYFAPHGFPDNTFARMAHGYDEEGTFGVNQDTTLYNNHGFTDGCMISTPDDLTRWLELLFTGKIISKKYLTMMTMENSIELINKNICLNKTSYLKKPMTEFRLGSLGMGLVYFKNYGFTWAHAGGVPSGYESFFTYNPCKDIYLTMAYNKKPIEQLVFVKIASDIFKVIDNSKDIKNQINIFQKNKQMPLFCKCR